MFTKEEGEGWTELGEALMPNSGEEAGSFLDAFKHYGESALNSVFGGSSVPDLNEAIGAMFGNKANVSVELPQVEFFDSSSPAFQQSPLTADLQGAPQTTGMELNAGQDKLSGGLDASAGADIGKSIAEMMRGMQDMLSSVFQGPLGVLGSLLNFLFSIFTQIISSISQVLMESARGAAALAADAWKKHLEMIT